MKVIAKHSVNNDRGKFTKGKEYKLDSFPCMSYFVREVIDDEGNKVTLSDYEIFVLFKEEE